MLSVYEKILKELLEEISIFPISCYFALSL